MATKMVFKVKISHFVPSNERIKHSLSLARGFEPE